MMSQVVSDFFVFFGPLARTVVPQRPSRGKLDVVEGCPSKHCFSDLGIMRLEDHQEMWLDLALEARMTFGESRATSDPAPLLVQGVEGMAVLQDLNLVIGELPDAVYGPA